MSGYGFDELNDDLTNMPPPVERPSGGNEQVLVVVGDIAVTETTLRTPNGMFDLRHSSWYVVDRSTTTTRIPPYAIVFAIVFALFCLLGLLFLLVKEPVTQGYIEVRVQGNGFQHVTQIPVQGRSTLALVNEQVSYVQGLVARAG